uniref:Pirin n=1 Tax=Heterosigma akashiwo TaxID=2829 RepID=A0A6V1NZX2_HETAK|mmetsp:Transcript_22489/g.31116  ORF Transcript_22489/g.31116 Transcript_22489/m.31116 type:complete len:379 (+) Transcript_22489:54-1190(+)
MVTRITLTRGQTLFFLLSLPMLLRAFNRGVTRKPMSKLIKETEPLGFPWFTMDPFLFCVFHEDFYPKGNEFLGPDEPLIGRNLGSDFTIKDGYRMYHGEVVPGFPGHPHRGFETVTVVNAGFVDHADSMGAAGRYGGGDTQWMTAGGGVQHSEMFPCLKRDKGNHLELFQIWLNLPKKDKMVDPYFTMLWQENLPRWTETNAAGKEADIQLVAGRIGEHCPPPPPPNSWAADPANDVMILGVKLQEGATWTMPAASGPEINRVLYFFKGEEVRLGEEAVSRHRAYVLRADRGFEVEALAGEVRCLVLQGRPIGEPVVQHGPFVMNTRREIMQCFEDYQRTEFGGWPWDSRDVTHGPDRGRFARHADGREEEPDDSPAT